MKQSQSEERTVQEAHVAQACGATSQGRAASERNRRKTEYSDLEASGSLLRGEW